MNRKSFNIVAKSAILPVPESYPSFEATGLPRRPRVVMPGTIPSKYTENLAAPVAEFSAFAMLLNNSTHDHFNTDVRDGQFRLYSRVLLAASWTSGKLSITLTSGTPAQRVEIEGGIEKTPIGTFVPPPLKVEDLKLRQVSSTQVDFGWMVLGRPHPMAEPLFEEVCHRQCVYIWHRIEGHISLVNGLPKAKIDISGSRFPSHAVFLDSKLVIKKHQGALGNLWVSDPRHPQRVTSSGPEEYSGSAFGGGSFGGGGASSSW